MQINQIRFAGLASGLDTESIVKELMNAERHPLNKLMQRKQVLEWQRDSYREVNLLLKEFDTQIFDGVFRQSTFNSKTVSTSNENAVTARAINASANVSTQIQVDQLATSEVWVAETNGEFVAQAGTLTFNVKQPGQTESTEVTIEIDENDTLQDVIRKFNNSNLGVTIFEDEFNGNLVMTMNATGAGAQIQVDGDTRNFMSSLGFQIDDEGVLLNGERGAQGQNAMFSINGYSTERTSNVFTLNGLEFTLKNKTNSPVTISTATDVDGIFDTIVKFVEEYNKIVDELNGKLVEPKYRDYPPLTDEQKEEMTESQIEMWEERAKSGLLRSDSIISGGLNQMRVDLYTGVELEDGTKLYLSDFGIKPVEDYTQRGRLEIDADLLREKIAEDPNKLYELFNGSSRSATDSANMGIAERLRHSMRQMTTQIEARAGNNMRTEHQYTIGRNILQVDDQIERMQDRLQRIEERYWRQFTAMEQVIQRANQQSMFIFEQFGGY